MHQPSRTRGAEPRAASHGPHPRPAPGDSTACGPDAQDDWDDLDDLDFVPPETDDDARWEEFGAELDQEEPEPEAGDFWPDHDDFDDI